MTEFCIKIYRFFRNHRAVFWVSMIALYAFFGYFASKIGNSRKEKQSLA